MSIPTRVPRKRLCLLLALALPGFAPALAQEATPAAPAAARPVAEPQGEGVVTADARAVLDRMQKYLSGLKTFSITAHSTRDEALPFGYKLQNNEVATMVVQRPNRMRVDVDGDIKHRSYYYDGSKLVVFAPDENVFLRSDAPPTIGEMTNGLLNAGVEMPLIDVLRQAVDKSLLKTVRMGVRVGDSMIDGVNTDHLAFRQPDVDWQLWVAKNGELKKLLITTRYEYGDPQYQAVLDWDTTPNISASTFTFTPPKDAREVPLLSSGLAAAASTP